MSGDHKVVLRTEYPLLQSFNRQDVLAVIVVNLGKLIPFIRVDMDSATRVDLAELIYKEVYFIKVPELNNLFGYLRQANYITRSANEVLKWVQVWCDRRALIAENDRPVDELIMKPEIMKAWYDKVKKDGVPESQTERRKKFAEYKAEYYPDSTGQTKCQYCGGQIFDPMTGKSIPHDIGKCRVEHEGSDENTCWRCGEQNYDPNTGRIVECACIRKKK